MTEAADFTLEVRDRNFVRLGQIAPEYMDLKFVDVHNGVGSWELKLPAEHPLLPSLKAKGSGIVLTEHWMEGVTHKYRVFSGRMRTARLSQNAEDPAGTWIVNGVDDNILGAASLVYPDPANLAGAQTLAYWEQSGTAETIMKLAVQANIGSTAIASRKYAWLSIATNLLRGGAVKCSSRFDVMGDLLTSLGTAANLGWEFRQAGNGVAFDVYTPANKVGEVRLDVRNGGLESSELGFSAPSATDVLVMGQGEGAARQIIRVTSTASDTEATNWGVRWEQTKDQRQTDDVAELTQAGNEVLLEAGSTVNSLKVVPSDAPGMALGRDWYRGDKITVVVEGQETTAVVTQVAVSISAAGVLRQATIGDPVGFDFDAKVASKIKDVEHRVGQVERLIGQGAQWSDIDNKPVGIFADSGDVKLTARATAPAGWLLADGASYTTAAQPALFAAIGYTYGGAGANFNVPNLAGRVPVGRDAAQPEFDVLGETGGAKAHTLSVDEMPSHTHTQNAHSHGVNGTGGAFLANGSGGATGNVTTGGGGYTLVGVANTTATNQNTGGGQAHNNLQPYLVMNYIIKT